MNEITLVLSEESVNAILLSLEMSKRRADVSEEAKLFTSELQKIIIAQWPKL